MSGKFSGFTQDDIAKLKNKNKENGIAPKTSAARPILRKQMPSAGGPAKTNQILATKTPPPEQLTATGGGGGADSNNLTTSSSTSSIACTDNSMQDAIHFKPLPQKVYGVPDLSLTSNDDSGRTAADDDSVQMMPPHATTPFKGISLKDYEAQRRMVEEQNKYKKEMLCKALEQHTERTAAEARKLKEIRAELSKLETELSADVAVLRKQIDSASLVYMNAQKNYQQIEGAFLKAKLELHQAREKKDMLAEHLSIIISNNEDRKADRLSQLMAKVGLPNYDNVAENIVE